MVSNVKFHRIWPRAPGAGIFQAAGSASIIAPHVPPFARVTHTAETPPKSLGGREEVSLYPCLLSRTGLPRQVKGIVYRSSIAIAIVAPILLSLALLEQHGERT